MSWKKSWKRIETGCTRCRERSSLATNETKMQFWVNKLTIRSCYVGTYEYGVRQLLGNYLSHKQHCICKRKNFSRWKIVPTPFHFCFLLIPYEKFIPPFNFAWLMLLQIKGTFVITFNAEMGKLPSFLRFLLMTNIKQLNIFYHWLQMERFHLLLVSRILMHYDLYPAQSQNVLSIEPRHIPIR